MASEIDEEERRLCAEFWNWLYQWRKDHGGNEPTTEEKRTMIEPLRQHRQKAGAK